MIHIYVSHAAELEAAAGKLKSVLNLYGAARLTVESFVDAPLSADMGEWTRERLAQAKLLLVLLSEPSASWDFSLFETGYFAGLGSDDDRRLVCIHPPEVVVPSSMLSYVCLAAEPETVEDFLRRLFGDTSITGEPQPINPTFASAPKKLAEAAREICEYLRPVKKRASVAKGVSLIVADPSAIDGEAIPGDARVAADALSLEVFGLVGDQEWRWRDLEDVAREHGGRRWTADVAGALLDVRRGRVPRQPRASFRSPRDGRQYRSFLGDVEELPSGAWAFDFSLVQDEGWTEGGGAVFGPPTRDGSWPDVFMLMPFEPEMESVFRKHVSGVASELGLSAQRADDMFSDRSITQDIWNAINNARVVVADCTRRNANVFYEIGIAHSVDKQTVLIAQSIEDIPFDLRHLRVIEYEPTDEGMKEFESKLKTAFEALGV